MDVERRTWRFDSDGELETELRAREGLPEHLEMTADGRVRCQGCGNEQLRPIVHEDDCDATAGDSP